MGINPEKLQQINTVLVIDDDDNWCFISQRVLKKAGVGKQILTASNGLEGIQKLMGINAEGEKLPDLIFLDIKMPVMDGFEFLDELSKSTELDLRHTRIYICTSSFHHQDREKADLFGVAGFITKPLTEDILKEILV
jgi:CheY-like chemotaxis protein